MFSDILLTVDFDRTLTGPDGAIPERNMEAIRWFTQNGGSFTVNTGRSIGTFHKYMDVVPANAPFLLYNGSVLYQNGQVIRNYAIDLPLWDTVMAVTQAYPTLNVEIQGLDGHYLVDVEPSFVALYEKMQWRYTLATPGDNVGPFIKFAVFGQIHNVALGDLYTATAEEEQQFRELEEFILSRWGDKVDICCPAPRIIDVQAKGVSKLRAARDLQKELGKKILVCVGDAHNDIPMLDGADYAYAPADGVIAQHYETVCNCADGAVADVIYKKIPEILGLNLDIRE